MAEAREAQPGARTSPGVDHSGSFTSLDHQASVTSAEHAPRSSGLTTSAVASSGSLSSTRAPSISEGSQPPILSTPCVSGALANNLGVMSALVMDSAAAVTSSLSVHDSHVAASLGSGVVYNTSVMATPLESLSRNSVVMAPQTYPTAPLESTLSYTLDGALVSVSSSGTTVLSSGSGAASFTASVLPSGTGTLPPKVKKGKKSGGKKSGAVVASSASMADIAAAAAAAVESELAGSTSNKVLQVVRSTNLPCPIPVPIYSQTVQAARASGNVLAERATIVRETVKFFLVQKYWWTTEDYDRIAEMVVQQFPELKDVPPSIGPCYGKVRLDLSMCARNFRRITKNQEKRRGRGSPALDAKDSFQANNNNTNSTSTSNNAEPNAPPPPLPPQTPAAAATKMLTPKGSKGGKKKKSTALSITVPTMVTLSSAAQMLPHTAHTSALHGATSAQDHKEEFQKYALHLPQKEVKRNKKVKKLASLPTYLLTSTPAPTTTTSANSTPTPTSSCTVLPPVAHFLGHPSSTPHHTTGGIVFPSLLPATHATSQPSPPPPPMSPAGGVATPKDGGREGVGSHQHPTPHPHHPTLTLSGAWRADAILPDPLPVPPYSEKVMKARKTGVTKHERPLIIRETVLFFLSLKYWWSSVDYDRISHFVVDYFPDLKDPMLSPNMPPNRRVRTDLSQTARNIRRREVMLQRRDSHSPEARFTAVGTVSLPPLGSQPITNDFCQELLAAANYIESRTAALHQGDINKALENHSHVSGRDSDTIATVLAHAHASSAKDLAGAGEDGKGTTGDGGKEMASDSGKYPYSAYVGGDTGDVAVNSQLAVIKQEVGDAEGDGYQSVGVLEAQASHWLSAQAMSQALSISALSSLSSLPPHVSQALSDHLLSSSASSTSPHTTIATTAAALPPPVAHQTGLAGSGGSSSSSLLLTHQTLADTSSAYTLSTPTPTLATEAGLVLSSDASPVDRMSAMAMWRSTCLPDPLPVPPYSLNVLRARDAGNTASARPRIVRETTQFFLALKMWWTAQDYERISDLVLREFPELQTVNISKDLSKSTDDHVHNIKKDLGTCARNMRRRLPMNKNRQLQAAAFTTSTSPQAALMEGEIGGGSVYEQNAWNLFYQQQFPASEPSTAPTPTPTLSLPSASRGAKRALSDASGSKQGGFELGERELAQALKQAVAQSVRQLEGTEPPSTTTTPRRHSLDPAAHLTAHKLKQEVLTTGKAAGGKTPSEAATSSSSSSSKSDSYPVMKELMSHPALSVRDPKLSAGDSPAFPNPIPTPAWTPAHAAQGGSEGGTGLGVEVGGYQHHHPTPARAHSQPACPLRSEVSLVESEEVPMNLTCAPPLASSEGPKQRGKSPKAVKTEGGGSKGGGKGSSSKSAEAVDAFSAREQMNEPINKAWPQEDEWSSCHQVWFPHGSPWKKSGQNMFRALPSPLPVPKYSHKLLKAREEGLAYRHRSEIIRETARFFLAFKYWWSSADYSRISELVVAEYPDLKDNITPAGQPCYRRVQRDLSMCARNLRRKNSRQQQLSSGEVVSTASSKKAKGGSGGGSSKEKKSKKFTAIKVEAPGELSSALQGAELASLAGSGVGTSLTTPLSTPSSSSSLVQAMLQASVDQVLSSIPPLSSPTFHLPSTSSSTAPWTVTQHAPAVTTSATILSHLVSPITTTTLSLPSHPPPSSTAYLPAYTAPGAVHPPAYSLVAHQPAQSVSVVVTAPGTALSSKASATTTTTTTTPTTTGVDRTLWPSMVSANGLGDPLPLTLPPPTTSKTAGKKKSGAQQASSKQTSKSGHGGAKSTASIQPKVAKPVKPVMTLATPTLTPTGSGGLPGVEGSGVGGKANSQQGDNKGGAGAHKKVKDSGGRGLGSRAGEGRVLSNTTAIVTPTLSEAHTHTSAGASNSEGGSVADKVYINPEHGSELQKQLCRLWLEGKFFDASLEVDNCRLPAHKLILLAASPYLQSTFRHANPTSHLEVNLPRDTGVEAARHFLKYVYQGVLHVTPATVPALRRIATMLQITQLLAYCDDFLMQRATTTSASSSSSSSAANSVASSVGLPHRSAVTHGSSQVKRVSVNLRESSHQHSHHHHHPSPTTEHSNPSTMTLTSTTLTGSVMQVLPNTAQYGSSSDIGHYTQYHHPTTTSTTTTTSSSSRKRKSSSVETPLAKARPYVTEGRVEGVEVYGADIGRRTVYKTDDDNNRQQAAAMDIHSASQHHLAKQFRSSEGSMDAASSSSQAFSEPQVGVRYQGVAHSWHRPQQDDRQQQQQGLAQPPLSAADKSQSGGVVVQHTSSVIHCGPNLMAASQQLPPPQGEVIVSSTAPGPPTSMPPIITTTTSAATAASVAGNSSSGSSIIATSNSLHMEGGESVVYYAADPSQVVGGEEGEGGVLVRLLPEGQVALEMEGEVALQPGAHTMHLTAEQALHLAGDGAIQLTPDQALQLTGGGGDPGSLQLTTGDSAPIQLTREEALELSQQLSSASQQHPSIHLTSHHPHHHQHQQLSAEHQQLSVEHQQFLEQQQQVSGETSLCAAGQQHGMSVSQEQVHLCPSRDGGEVSVHSAQSMPGGVEGYRTEEHCVYAAQQDVGGEDGSRTTGMGAELGRWELGGGDEEEVVIEEGGVEGGEEEVMVEEVIVQSGDLLQDVDVAACETVECSLLPQTYCSSPEQREEGGEEQVVVEMSMEMEMVGGGEEGVRGEEQQVEEAAALQSLASQWARQQYAQAPLDAHTAQQFAAVLKERMYGQQPATPTPTSSSSSLHPTPPPPPSYQEAVYVDGDRVYISQGVVVEGGEELVVETSIPSHASPQTAEDRERGEDDQDEGGASLLPQTYCSSPPPHSQSPSNNG